jgi:hypothetical protein
MKLTVVGGGGFRVPLVYGALLARADRLSARGAFVLEQQRAFYAQEKEAFPA